VNANTQQKPPLVEANAVWSMDFLMDVLANGRRLKCRTIVDDFTKESVDLVVDHSISGMYISRVLGSGGAISRLSAFIDSHGNSVDRFAIL